MFNERKAIDIAEQMSKGGKRPSIRTVRRALAEKGNSGSLRRVAEVLQNWRTERGLSEFEADTGVPPEFQTRIDAITTTLWDAAHRKASVELAKARERLASLEASLAAAEETNQVLRAENHSLQQRIDELDRRYDRRAREFWDRVVIGIGDMLKKSKPLSSAEIFEKLPAEVRREWLYHVEPIKPSTIAKKLKERGGRGRYVIPEGNKWRYCPPADRKQPSRLGPGDPQES